MFVDSWTGILRVLVIGPLAYVALIVMLRISGPRTLAKMSAYDFVVTIAIGSMLASIIVTDTVSLVEGVVAMLTLILLQYGITWLTVRSEGVSQVVKGEPLLVYHHERFLRLQMKRARVTDGEVRTAARLNGHAEMVDVDSVVLETDGTLSVLARAPGDNPTIDVPAE